MKKKKKITIADLQRRVDALRRDPRNDMEYAMGMPAGTPEREGFDAFKRNLERMMAHQRLIGALEILTKPKKKRK